MQIIFLLIPKCQDGNDFLMQNDFTNFRLNSETPQILMISRRKWKGCNNIEPPCYEKYSGVIIYDDNWACENKNELFGKTDSCFRPSFPTNDLM